MWTTTTVLDDLLEEYLTTEYIHDILIEVSVNGISLLGIEPFLE